MTRFQTFTPDMEVWGQVMMSFANATRAENIIPYLKKHNLFPIDPDRWYLAQPFLDVLHDIYEVDKTESVSDFVSIGLRISEEVLFPEDYDQYSFEEKMMIWDGVYQANHRGSMVGGIESELVIPGHIRYVLNTIYPDDLNYGVLYGIVRKHIPANTQFTVSYDESESPRSDNGGDFSVFDLKWMHK